MSALRSKTILMVLILAALFCAGLVKLFLLRFEAGDVYPLYSSMRSDPLGTQALFEGLNEMEEGTAQRHFRPLDKIEFTAERTILLCGLPASVAWQMRGKTWERMLDALESNGGRLILTFTATSRRLEEEDGNAPGGQEEEEEDTSPEEEEPAPGEDSDETVDWQGLDELGVSIERAGGEETKAPALLAAGDPRNPLPDKLPWHGALFFDTLEEDWQVLYTRDDNAVMIRRTWGHGTLIMVADSYLVSNEALRKNRYPDLLAWLLGPWHDVVFDESHLGLAKQPGIASLALKYHLQGLIAVVMLIAVLMIWRQTAVFVPAQLPEKDEAADLSPSIGRDTAEGLVHLMRQHIAPQEVLDVCHENWIHSAAINQVPEEKMARVEEVLATYRQAPRAHNPVDVYRSICNLLKQGKSYDS